jgi:hypothetical protein
MDQFFVIYRYRTDELHQFMAAINAACEQSPKKSPKIPKLKPDTISFNFQPQQAINL